jgi:single-strand DNA-binding protein
MSSIEVALFGVLGRDGELKTSKNGKAYLRMNVRTGDGDGAQWVSVMLFGDDVPELAQRLVKGARVYVEGSLKLDSWRGQDGTERHGLSVMSWHCRLAEIGRNKPKRDSADKPRTKAAASSTDSHSRDQRVRGIADPELNDEVPF